MTDGMWKILSTVFIASFLFFSGESGIGLAFEYDFNHLFSFGKFGNGKEQFDGPRGIVEDERENLYILDARNYRVQKVNYRGRFIDEWGDRGFKEGEFRDPVSIQIDESGDIYVVDRGNHRIQKFDSDGELLLSFGSLGTADGKFRDPMDIAFDREGNIYVADYGNHRIQKFDRDLKLLQIWGRFERKGKQVRNPVSLAYSEEGFGYILVADGKSCKLQKFDLTGNFKGEWDLHPPGKGFKCGPVMIRVEPRTYNIYVADPENDIVSVFDRKGEQVGELEGPKEKFSKPFGIFVNDVEEIWVVDTGNTKIHKFRRE